MNSSTNVDPIVAKKQHSSKKLPNFKEIQKNMIERQNYQFEPLSLEILKTAYQIHDIPELHHRLVAATARHLGLPQIANDPDISQPEFVQILR